MLLALVEANKYIWVNGKSLLECWEDKDSFQLLDDTIEDFIMKKTENKDGKLVNFLMAKNIISTTFSK